MKMLQKKLQEIKKTAVTVMLASGVSVLFMSCTATDQTGEISGQVTELKQRAAAFYNQQQYDEALETYRKVTEIDPDNENAWYNMGLLKIREFRQNEEALHAFKRSTEINPSNDDAWSQKGLALARLDRDKEALAAYERALEINPQNAFTWYYKAATLYHADRPDEAFCAYVKTTELDPQNVEAWYAQGVLLNNHFRNHEKAVRPLKKVLELDPEHESAWLNLGNAYYETESYDAALEAFERAIELNPNFARAWHNKASLLFDHAKKYNEALDTIKQAVSIISDDPSLWIIKGMMMLGFEEYERAEEAFARATQLQPGDYSAWAGKGAAREGSGRINEAEEAYERARELNPNYKRKLTGNENEGEKKDSTQTITEDDIAYEEQDKDMPSIEIGKCEDDIPTATVVKDGETIFEFTGSLPYRISQAEISISGHYLLLYLDLEFDFYHRNVKIFRLVDGKLIGEFDPHRLSSVRWTYGDKILNFVGAGTGIHVIRVYDILGFKLYAETTTGSKKSRDGYFVAYPTGWGQPYISIYDVNTGERTVLLDDYFKDGYHGYPDVKFTDTEIKVTTFKDRDMETYDLIKGETLIFKLPASPPGMEKD